MRLLHSDFSDWPDYASEHIWEEGICHGIISPKLVLDRFGSAEFDCWGEWEDLVSMEFDLDYDSHGCEYGSTYQEIWDDIRIHGVTVPVFLNFGTATFYNGHHRLWAASNLGLTAIPFVNAHSFHLSTCAHW